MAVQRKNVCKNAANTGESRVERWKESKALDPAFPEARPIPGLFSYLSH